jgi:hypothetical protein
MGCGRSQPTNYEVLMAGNLSQPGNFKEMWKEYQLPHYENPIKLKESSCTGARTNKERVTFRQNYREGQSSGQLKSIGKFDRYKDRSKANKRQVKCKKIQLDALEDFEEDAGLSETIRMPELKEVAQRKFGRVNNIYSDEYVVPNRFESQMITFPLENVPCANIPDVHCICNLNYLSNTPGKSRDFGLQDIKITGVMGDKTQVEDFSLTRQMIKDKETPKLQTHMLYRLIGGIDDSCVKFENRGTSLSNAFESLSASCEYTSSNGSIEAYQFTPQDTESNGSNYDLTSTEFEIDNTLTSVTPDHELIIDTDPFGLGLSVMQMLEDYSTDASDQRGIDCREKLKGVDKDHFDQL